MLPSKMSKAKYFVDLQFRTILRKQNSKLCILSLNCQSLNAKFDNLKMFIDYVNDQCTIFVICIQESWSHDGIDMSYFYLPNYTMANQNRRLSAHGGLILRIFMMTLPIESSIIMIPATVTSNLFEILFIEIRRRSFERQKYIVGNIYHIPSYISDDVTSFRSHKIEL